MGKLCLFLYRAHLRNMMKKPRMNKIYGVQI